MSRHCSLRAAVSTERTQQEATRNLREVILYLCLKLQCYLDRFLRRWNSRFYLDPPPK